MRESRIAIDAFRAFPSEFLKLDGPNARSGAAGHIADYYSKQYLPQLQKLVKPRADFEEYLPIGRGAYALQAAFLVKSPFPTGEKQNWMSSAYVPGYSRVHATYHRSFRKITEEFGYYDMFLMDTIKRPNRVSVKKEVDFATSLYIGPYRNSGLANACEIAGSRMTNTE